MRIHLLVVACAFGVTAATAAQPASAQATAAGSALTLTTAERARIVSRVAADPNLRQIVGEKPRVIVGEPLFDKNEAVNAAGARVLVRRIPIVAFNPQTNRAASALVTPDGRVSGVENLAVVLVPFTADDVVDALGLVRRNGGERIPNLARYRPETQAGASSRAYVAQLLPVRGADDSDPCFADRCADLIFLAPNGYLRTRAHVDLTKRTVEFVGAQR